MLSQAGGKTKQLKHWWRIQYFISSSLPDKVLLTSAHRIFLTYLDKTKHHCNVSNSLGAASLIHADTANRHRNTALKDWVQAEHYLATGSGMGEVKKKKI